MTHAAHITYATKLVLSAKVRKKKNKYYIYIVQNEVIKYFSAAQVFDPVLSVVGQLQASLSMLFN